MNRYLTPLIVVFTVLCSALAAAAATDVLRGAVDPYIPGRERARFLKAAGVDSELDRGEFDSDASSEDGFARKFDKWSSVKGFDESRDGKINWFEANAYRLALRKAVVAAYDKNNNERLEGEEREAANKDLGEGKVPNIDRPAPPRPAVAAAPRADDGRFGNFRERRAEFMRRFDTDGDGRLSDQERIAAGIDRGRQMRQDMLARYDIDGDGLISDGERAEMPIQFQAMSRLSEYVILTFDENGDGDIDQIEGQAIAAFGQKFRRIGEDWSLKIADLNGDGTIDRQEQQQARQKFTAVGMQMLPRLMSWGDTDGDGQVSQGEQAEAFQRVSRSVDAKLKEWGRTYDSDGDGRLDAGERNAFADGFRDHYDQAYLDHDSDGDGRLNVNEWTDFIDSIATEWGIKPTRLQ